MSNILESMFSGLVVYLWINPDDEADSGALLVRADDLGIVQDLTENIPDNQRQATSFHDLKELLQMEDVEFYDMYDNYYTYIHDTQVR